MRFPEDKIKEAILHPVNAIRLRAVSCFDYSFSLDPTLIPLVIKAIETCGSTKLWFQFPFIRWLHNALNRTSHFTGNSSRKHAPVPPSAGR
jgi:hypothetical protein